MFAMLRFVALIAILPACFWEHGKGGGGGGDDDCLFPAKDLPGIAPAPLRDPGTLLCQSFGTGCNPDCGPCPETTDTTPARTPPIPTWGFCGSPCEGLAESQCKADPTCRVVKDANCTIGAVDCITDFLGCFPTDTQVDASVDCFMADAWTCSRSHACEAHHAQGPCPTGGECSRPFATCVPAGVDPGTCTGQVTCRAATPSCPAGTTPGIAGGCFTGACIDTSACP
jgi:hypothetical protein